MTNEQEQFASDLYNQLIDNDQAIVRVKGKEFKVFNYDEWLNGDDTNAWRS